MTDHGTPIAAERNKCIEALRALLQTESHFGSSNLFLIVSETRDFREHLFSSEPLGQSKCSLQPIELKFGRCPTT